jgi:glycosyltransferase involved in cell wall biosynthesis
MDRHKLNVADHQGIVLSVVIACYNGAKTLPVQLEALSKQEWSRPWEVVLADNGSTDDSAEIARDYVKKLPNLRVVDASACQGQPFALNTGVRASRGGLIALCDADDEVAPGWLAGMGEALLQHDFVACSMDHVKLNPAWLQLRIQKTELQRLWYPPFLHHAGGATLGFKRTLYDDLGGFDERLRHLQDTEFCVRAQLKGIPLIFVSTAVLHYRRRSTLRAHFSQARNYAEENAILAKRYFPRDKSASEYYKFFFREWVRLARDIRWSRSVNERRFAWFWRLGSQVGRLSGLVRHGGIPV